MLFVPARIESRSTGNQTTGYVPDIFDNRAIARPGDSYIDIQVDGIPRVAYASTIKLLEKFTAESHRRAELGHNCAVFALAHHTGKSYSDTLFNRKGGQKVSIGQAERIEPANHASSAEIIFTSSWADTPEQELNVASDPHFLVRATVDEGSPLYASKLGGIGPVALLTFEQSSRLYPVTAAWTVHDLQAVDF